MEEESSESNIEWKKNKGFGETEKLTRKVDIKKALQFEATEKKPLQNGFSPRPTELPKGLKKIRKKIKDVYDDEEDEEENFYDFAPLEQNNSLLNALNEEEKRQLKQQEVIDNQRMQQNAGKMEALTVANKVSKQLGLKGLDKATINQNMQTVSQGSATYYEALKDNVAKKVKVNRRKLSKGETVTLLRGIKRIQNIALVAEESQLKALEGMKVEDLMNAGSSQTKDEQVAEIILKKSGRKNKKDAKQIAQKAKKPLTKIKNKDLLKSKELYRE